MSSGIWLAVLAATAIAVQSLSVRASTRTQRVDDVVALLFVVNCLVLLPVAAVVHYPAYSLSVSSVVAFGVAGILGSLVARMALFVGIARLGASRAEPLKSTFPLVSVVAAVLVLGDQLTASLVVGVTLIVGGAAAVSWDARASDVTAPGRQALSDLRFPLLAALLLGIDPIFTKIGLESGTPALVGVTVRVLAAAAGFCVYTLWRRRRNGRGLSIRPTRWTLLAAGANTTYLLSYLGALATTDVSVVAPILGVSPLLVILGAAVFAQQDEHVTPRLGVAVTVLVAGVVLVVRG